MKILLLQTAFIGDVILATSLAEKLHQTFPEAQIDFMLRKGNEGLFKGHPFIHNIWVWDKKEGKYSNLFKLLTPIRAERYDLLVNVQRFATTGLFSILAGAKDVVGFSKNPFSPFFTHRVPHQIGGGFHEVERNLRLIEDLTDGQIAMPKLYPTNEDFKKVQSYKTEDYVTISPTSVWFTKQLPAEKWTKLCSILPEKYSIYLLGGPTDYQACEDLVEQTNGRTTNLAGKFSLLQSAAFMSGATMNYVNDSAPQHLASAMNAPITTVFCSTIPEFGFGPLSKASRIIQVDEKLSCRPCGLHGYKKCPQGHFMCAHNIDVRKMLFS
jgi:heptosyltransferase-2